MNNQDENYYRFYKDYNDKILNKNALDKLLNPTSYKNSEIKIHELHIEPKISIIITTYNRKKQLEECINSILMQKYFNYEIIIVDDCSNDNTEEYITDIFKDKRIKYFRNEENLGASESRKKGYLKSRGTYIIFCDDDDYYIDNYFFAECIRILEKKQISMICANSYIKYEKENIFKFLQLNFPKEISSYEYLKNFQFNYLKPNSTFCCIFRKEILNNAKIYDMDMVNDSSIYMKALTQKGIVYNYQKIVGVYRIHSANITFNISNDFIMKNLIEKKRIYEFLKERKAWDKADEWYRKQMELTIRYYIFGSKPSKEDVEKIFEWLKANKIEYYSIWFNIKLFQSKLKMKRIIKRENFM